MIRKNILHFGNAISKQQFEDKNIISVIKEIYFSHVIDHIKDLNRDEILFLAKSFNSGYTTDLNQDAITAIVNSSNFPIKDILNLENFGDSLLALKIEIVNEIIPHKLSYYENIYMDKDNFKTVITKIESIKLSQIDIDYIFAIGFMLKKANQDRNFSSILEKSIKNVEYDYLSYFSMEGIIAAELLGLDIGDNESSISYEVNVKDIYSLKASKPAPTEQ